MALMDKLKDFFTVSEEEYYDDVEQDNVEAETEKKVEKEERFSQKTTTKQTSTPRTSFTAKSSSSVVDFSSATSKPHVVFAKLSRFEDVGAVATNLNEKKIVILNLEDAEDRESRRIIDFLYGVAFANGGQIKRVATRTFVLTPHNIPFTGELLDEISGSGITLFD